MTSNRRTLAACIALVALGGCVACGADRPDSFVGISVSGCAPAPAEGSGVVVADDVVLTSAHVLRGAESITVEWPGGPTEAADIVGFDPDMDLAYLAVPTHGARPIRVDSTHAEAGDRGQAFVSRDGEVVAIEVVVERRVRIDTEDIYVEGETERPGWVLEAEIVPGDSGGAVVVDGAVVGVLWARSSGTAGQSYAIDPSRGGDRIERQRLDGRLGADIDLARCS